MLIDVVPVFEVVDPSDRARHAAESERCSEREEREDDDHVRRPVERSGHLPDLGVDEQERVEEQEQWEGARHQRAERRELSGATTSGPAQQGSHAVRRPDVDEDEQDQGDDDAFERVAGLTEQQHRECRADHEESEFRSVDVGGPGERRDPA